MAIASFAVPPLSQFNERTATPYNELEFPTDIVLLVVLWRLRYKLSRRDLPVMFLHRGFECTHEAVRDWEARFALLFTQQLRAKRKGQVGRSWHGDETYSRVAGRWTYLYRAIDREGNLVEKMLSHHRDMPSAKRLEGRLGAGWANTGARDDRRTWLLSASHS